MKDKFKQWVTAIFSILALLANFVITMSALLRSKTKAVAFVFILLGSSALIYFFCAPFYFYGWLFLVLLGYLIALAWLHSQRSMNAENPSEPPKST